jgi:hypothetical protein
MENWNVEALAEIPLRREKNGKMEFDNEIIRQFDYGRMRRMDDWKKCDPR